MPKTIPKDKCYEWTGILERLFAGVGHFRVLYELLEADGEISQIELAKKADVSPSGVYRIMENIRENEELEKAFLSERKYNARIYSVNKDHYVVKKLIDLFYEQ